jgi:two-component system chemotaxis sensor kinase CheA
MFIVAAAALALVLLLSTGALVASRVEQQLSLIQLRYVPKLELGPRLESQFEHVVRSLQDAVAAQEIAGLSEAGQRKAELNAQLLAARRALDPTGTELLRNAIDDYYALARETSRRLIAGETGEDLVGALSTMQTKQARAVELLRKVVAFDRNELSEAFSAVSRTELEASRIRLAVSLLCLLTVTLFTLWVSRGVLRSLSALAEGLERFGRGEFGEPIALQSRDELADLAARANRMAQRLRGLNQDRDRADWLKNGQAKLSDALRGELDVAEVAERALTVLAQYLDAPVAALYYARDAGRFERVGGYACPAAGGGEGTPSFRLGEGLIGQAALQTEISFVHDVPEGHLPLRSGLGHSAPQQLVFVPLRQFGRVIGVLELGCIGPWSASQTELLASVRETIAIALEVARARAALRALLGETQSQARRLSDQEEELRASNEELHSQQDEMRRSNRALSRQADELKQQRVALERKNSELAAAQKELQQSAAELRTVSAYKTQFLANMSHELRTPLNSMLLLSALLAGNENANLSDKQVEYCRTIHGAGVDLLALIDQVLDLAKIEAGKQQITLSEVTPDELVDHARRVFGPVARHKSLELEVEVRDGCPAKVWTDRQRVLQILNNLLGNAFKFTKQGKVTLSVGAAGPNARLRRASLQPGATLELSVSDTGMGIAAAEQERIFAPFEQADVAADRRFGGTGLGLTIARELAQLLGGELSVHSTLGQGSTFVCHLPYESAPLYDTDRIPRPANDATPPARSSLLPVLLVEDDSDHAEVLTRRLTAQQMGVQSCVSAEEALECLAQPGAAFSCMVLDLGLPSMDGLELLDTVRARPGTETLPVIVYTGSALSKQEADRLAAHSEAVVLKKGAGVDRVIDEIRVLTQRSTVAREPAPRTLGPATTPVRLDGRRVLIADDDMRTVYALSALLRAKGATVEVADTGRLACSQLEQHAFDALLLDLMMPEMDGYQVLAWLRERERFASLPVLVLTAKAMKNDQQKCLEAGATAYLAKPVDADRLLTLLHEQLGDDGRVRRAAGN